MDAVVDRHNRAAGSEGRQHVVGRMEQIGLCARHAQGNRQLLGNGVVRGSVRQRSKIRTERFEPLAVGAPAHQDILALPVEPGEPFQEIAYVGADAEIMQFSDVNGDSHLVSRQPGTGAGDRTRDTGAVADRLPS